MVNIKFQRRTRFVDMNVFYNIRLGQNVYRNSFFYVDKLRSESTKSILTEFEKKSTIEGCTSSSEESSLESGGRE